MNISGIRATYIGGPTVLIEVDGFRILTDPTFDAGGTEYATSLYTLRKLSGPAVEPEAIEPIDLVLLSHDHHYDNLDRSGRELLGKVPVVLTTTEGASRLGASAVGLRPWETFTLRATDGRTLRITATPARHGPADGDRGPVIGFLLGDADGGQPAVYISGDTVWYDGVAEVARRANVGLAFVNLGAARVTEVGPAHLTLLADETVEVARAFPGARLIPLHYDGWAHFSEGRAEVDAAFARAGLAEHLCWLAPGIATPLALAHSTAT